MWNVISKHDVELRYLIQRIFIAKSKFSLPYSIHVGYIETLKALDTLGSLIVKDQYSHLVYPKCQKMHKMANLWKFNRPSMLRKNNEGEKSLLAQICVLSLTSSQMSNERLHSWIHLLYEWKITPFPKNMLPYFIGSCFSQCFIL